MLVSISMIWYRFWPTGKTTIKNLYQMANEFKIHDNMIIHWRPVLDDLCGGLSSLGHLHQIKPLFESFEELFVYREEYNITPDDTACAQSYCVSCISFWAESHCGTSYVFLSGLWWKWLVALQLHTEQEWFLLPVAWKPSFDTQISIATTRAVL